MKRGLLYVVLVVGALLAPGSALAVADPQQLIGGAGSKWFSGSLLQQIGDNCSILGSPYTEVMIGGVGSYGGAPGNGVVKVGDAYWASLLVSVPGNPCGTGVSSVVTDLVLPRNTTYDSSRPIRCFATHRFSSDFGEVTNETWSFLGYSGRYCPTGPTVAPIGQRFGYRPLANGQLFEIFVPVKSTSTLQGAGSSDEFNWLTQATGVYANPGRSFIWANVFPGSTAGQDPYVYFANDPAAIPYWCATCPAGTQNRVEFFANVYTAGVGGTLHYDIRRTDNNALVAQDINDVGYNGTVAAGQTLVQVLATGASAGPNGGYVPFYYEQALGEWDAPMRIQWDFQYGAGLHKYGTATFRTLTGPSDCDNGSGTVPASCLAPAPHLTGRAAVAAGAKLRRAKLAVGLKINLTCNLSSKATAKLTLSRRVARSLGLSATTPIAKGSGTCNSTAGGSLKLKLTARAANKLRGHKVAATLTITFTRPGSTAKFVRSVKIV